MSIQLSFRRSSLRFRFPFTIAHGTRQFTDTVLLRASYGDHYGYGEATLPPYLSDNAESTQQFFNFPEVRQIEYPFDPSSLFDHLDKLHPGCYPAKAALDMALWELKASIENKSLNEILEVKNGRQIPHTYSIGVSDKDELQKKIEDGLFHGFQYFKLKLDGVHDRRIIREYLDLTDKKFTVDANASWSDPQKAISFCRDLEKAGCLLVEQPFPVSEKGFHRILSESTSLPVIADEAFQSQYDLEDLKDHYTGINLKLQKCGGITPALRIIKKARELDLKILIGCMSESSIGCNAAEILSPLCDWADLDGPFLISNDHEIRNEVASL